jgi:hypothetical protein
MVNQGAGKIIQIWWELLFMMQHTRLLFLEFSPAILLTFTAIPCLKTTDNTIFKELNPFAVDIVGF